MRFLLDTSVWLWSVGKVDRLNREAQSVLISPENDLYFSAASVWEIAIKVSIGRLQLLESIHTLIPRETARLNLRPLAVSYIHAMAVYDLPIHHGDPFDRLLVAQARTEGLTIITSDREIQSYSVPFLWAGQ